MSSDNDPDARWRDPRQYGPSAEALFRRHDTPLLLYGYVCALKEIAESEGRLACDSTWARRLYNAWAESPPATQEELVGECHAAFLGALLFHIEWAARENFDTRSKTFTDGRDVLLALLREFAALEEKPLAESPDFTGHITAELAREKSSSTHLAAAILFTAGYIPITGPIFDQDPIFDRINHYSPNDVTIDWTTDKARHIFQSASYYLENWGPNCEQQILVRMSGVGQGEVAAAYKDKLREALENYIWDYENHKRLMKNKRGWTLLNLVYAAGKRMRR